MNPFRILLIKALNGDRKASVGLEDILNNNNIAKEDKKFLLTELDKARENNNPLAFFLRGLVCELGIECAIDENAAIDFYKQGCELGNIGAINSLGQRYINGRGVAIDYPAAMRLFDQAIALGSKTALVNKARMYREGQGVAKDFIYAAKLLRMSQDLGNAQLKHLVQLVKSLPQDATETKEEVNYHAYWALKKTAYLELISPATFLSLMAKDELLEDHVKLNEVGNIIQLYPLLPAKMFDGMNLLGEFYYQKAKTIIQKLPCLPDAQQKQEMLDEAIKLLEKVPLGSPKRGLALFDAGYILYQNHKEKDMPGAVRLAMPYFKASMKLDFLDAEEFYKKMMLDYLDKTENDFRYLEEIENAVKDKLSPCSPRSYQNTLFGPSKKREAGESVLTVNKLKRM